MLLRGSQERFTDLQAMLPLVVECEALCSALSLVVAAALADAVDIAPVGLCLRVLQRVSIHLEHRCTRSSPSLPAEQQLSSYLSPSMGGLVAITATKRLSTSALHSMCACCRTAFPSCYPPHVCMQHGTMPEALRRCALPWHGMPCTMMFE